MLNFFYYLLIIMEKFNDKFRYITVSENRTEYDEIYNNGLIINEKYIPEELLSEIFCYVDYKTLFTCQLVCKCWNTLIQNYIWRKKAEMISGHTLPIDENAPWTTYYLICDKKPFNKNLIKNECINRNFKNNWKIIDNGGNGWKVESPPEGVPSLPEDPIFVNKNLCFVTSYDKCSKYQIVNLIQEGFSEYLLDNWQPIIKISEYYSCRWDCSGEYACHIDLFNDKDILDTYSFSRIIQNGEQNEWFKFEYEFKNYGKGLRKIKFTHEGKDRQFWAGHYGTKMAGTCIKIEIDEFHQIID